MKCFTENKKVRPTVPFTTSTTMPAKLRPVHRRVFLRGSGVAIALPLLDSMRTSQAASSAAVAPMRMLCICTNMGMMPQYFFPSESGRDYRTSEYLAKLDSIRDHFTVFSGLSHPEVDGGHHAETSFLTAAPHPGSSGFRNTISLDQFAAQQIGTQARFPYLALNVGAEGQNGLSWTSAGVMIPAQKKPSAVFRQLFVQGSQAEIDAQLRRLRDGRSVLDTVAERARRFTARLGSEDRQKMQQYLSSVRELERRMVETESWVHRPKPVVDAETPTDIEAPGELIASSRLMYQMATLALQTDSTRIITLKIDQNSNPRVNLPGVTQGHHSLTHHGRRSESIQQLKTIELSQTEVFGQLLAGLKNVEEGGGTLLDHTMVLYGSNLGNANSHDNKNLPILIAGGGFRHAGHVAFDRGRNKPLANLFVNMLQRMGIETDRFASSTGTLKEIL